MKVLINIPADVALKNGSDEHGDRVIDLPAASLTAEQREELANHTWFPASAKARADFNLVNFSINEVPYQPVAFTADEAIKAIESCIANRAADAAKEAERQAKAKADHEEAVRAWLAAPVDDFICYNWNSSRGHNVYELRSGRIPQDPRLSDRIAEAEAEAKRLTEAARQAKAESDARKVVGTAKLKAWAESHGSDLLKARIAEGFAWEDLAEAEYGEAAFKRLGYPEADDPGSPSAKDCTTPTLPEIEALRVVRKRITDLDLPARAELTRFVCTPETDPDDYPDDDEEPVKRNEIEVTITTPNGEVRNYYLLPKDVV